MKKLDPDEARATMLRAGVLPLEDFATSSSKWKCRCLTCGQITYPAHSSIKQNPKSKGCNFCAKERTQVVLRSRNYASALAFLSEVELEIVGPYVSAKSRAEFHCLRCDERFSSTFMDVKGGRKVCLCKKLPRRSLVDAFPELARELHPSANGLKTGETIGTGMRSNVWWVCQKNHEYEASPANRVRGSSCRYCMGMEAYKGESDIMTLFPELCSELASVKDRELAKDTRPGSNRNLSWRCKVDNSHVYKMSPVNRISRGAGCSYCAGKRVLEGNNDFASQFPEIALEWDYDANYPIRPEKVHQGSNTKFFWICSFNPEHKWHTSPQSRQTRGCQKCSWFQPGRNDLQTKAVGAGRLYLVEEWDKELNGCEPNQVAYASNDLAHWICAKFPGSHKYQATTSNRWFGNSGCPTCAPTGYDANSAGILYFIHNKKLAARKIGITNLDARTKRIEKFVSSGWEIVRTYTHENGLLIRKTEEVLLRKIREEHGLPQYLTQQDMRGMSGATETFSEDGVSNDFLLREIEYEYLRAQARLDVARNDSIVLA